MDWKVSDIREDHAAFTASEPERRSSFLSWPASLRLAVGISTEQGSSFAVQGVFNCPGGESRTQKYDRVPCQRIWLVRIYRQMGRNRSTTVFFCGNGRVRPPTISRGFKADSPVWAAGSLVERDAGSIAANRYRLLVNPLVIAVRLRNHSGMVAQSYGVVVRLPIACRPALLWAESIDCVWSLSAIPRAPISRMSISFASRSLLRPTSWRR
jgi:hypothetical protein